MKEHSSGKDPIQEEREYYRRIFWSAYALFREKSQASTPAILPDGSYTQPGGPHDPAWEKWARWRVEFYLVGKERLHGCELEIFTSHMCMGLDRRETMQRIGMSACSTFASYENMIAEKMGHWLEDGGIWPVSVYLGKKDEVA